MSESHADAGVDADSGLRVELDMGKPIILMLIAIAILTTAFIWLYRTLWWPGEEEYDYVIVAFVSMVMLCCLWGFISSFAVLWAVSRTGFALAVTAQGVQHFVAGYLPWSEVQRVYLEERKTVRPRPPRHWLLELLIDEKKHQIQYDLSHHVHVQLDVLTYQLVKERVSWLDRQVFRVAVNYEDAKHTLILHCSWLDCSPKRVAKFAQKFVN
ncbi:MAG: hypothetical protein ACKVOO_07725 [Burkholderiaceae bacterium]